MYVWFSLIGNKDTLSLRQIKSCYLTIGCHTFTEYGVFITCHKNVVGTFTVGQHNLSFRWVLSLWRGIGIDKLEYPINI